MGALPVLVGQVSDLHLGDDPTATARAARVFAHLGAMATRLDALVLTGDLTDAGTDAAYAVLSGLLDAHLPGGPALVYCPGNHDERAAYQRFLAARGGPRDGVHRLPGLTVLALDTLVPGAPHGELGDAGARRLWAELAAAPPDRPVVLAMHHPPVPVHSEWLDSMPLTDPARLAAAIEASGRRPDLVLTGHTHAATATAWHGIPVRGSGAVRSTLISEWESGVADHLTDDVPPMLAFHHLSPAATGGGGGAGAGPATVTTRWRALPAS